MKKQLLLILLLLMLALTSYEQTSIDSNRIVHTDYLTKSKKQRTAAWVCLGGGFILTSTGFIIGLNSAVDELADAFGGKKDNTFEIGAVLFFTGTISMLSSIPLFIASSKNKKKGLALSTSFKIEKANTIKNYCMSKSSYPAFSIKINF